MPSTSLATQDRSFLQYLPQTDLQSFQRNRSKHIDKSREAPDDDVGSCHRFVPLMQARLMNYH